ncbi:hypothetical protein EP7_003358 [Isosphaeraceae bacterium EP7]
MLPTLTICVLTATLGLLQVDAPIRRADVSVENAEVYARPDATAFVTAQLARGSVVEVHRTLDGGWVEVTPPVGSVDWIDEADLEILDANWARVEGKDTTVRFGNAEATSPGPVRCKLGAGTELRLLDLDPLATKQGKKTRTWRAVWPTENSTAYLRLDDLGPFRPNRPASGTATEPRQADPSTIRVGLESGPARDELADLDLQVAATLRDPVETWRFATIRSRLIALRDAADSGGRVEIERRLDRLSKLEASAQSARSFVAIIQKSRERDAKLKVERGERDEEETEAEEAEPFAATGLLQSSSRLIEGRKAAALIGKNGRAIAYLDLPVGVDSQKLMGSRVGVRGVTRFDEKLKARVIHVSELETLGRGL